jgi:FlaA1/EpsC-like NDP-sugar epimerase
MKAFNINANALLAFLHDAVALAGSWVAAYLLLQRQGSNTESLAFLGWALALALAVQGLVNAAFGVYQGIWRYSSVPDVQRIVAGAIAGTGIMGLALAFTPGASLTLPYFIIQPMILIFVMAGSRISYRSWKEYTLYGKSGQVGTPVIVLGAGDAAVGLVKELLRSQDWRVVALLDDDAHKRNRVLHGVRVLGELNDLPRVAQRLKVRHAIVAMPSVPYRVRRRVVEVCKKAGVTAMTVPTFNQLTSAKAAPPKIRKVAVEDLMKRESVTLDDAGLHDLLSAKVVMVTGAGGSIGSELCLQIAAYQPSMLVLFEQNEFAMYCIEQALRDNFPEMPVANAIGDIKNAPRVNQVMHQYSPAVVFHAAAYKHVPLMEEANAWEAVQNNVLGTYLVARAAIDYGVRKFVFVSTDKAVNPTNVMGATKRLAEMICQALQQSTPIPRFEMVRFGNVLGSAGSVIPRFAEQIERGGPVTVTHPDMVRYFMSIPEAAQLVLQAGCMGLGGEIFVMDMGEPVKILDLANDMIRLSEGAESDIKIVYTGLRPGEKLFEELLADDEHTRPTPHPKLRIAKAREVDPAWLKGLLQWLNQDRIPDDIEVRRDLKRWVPEYVSAVRPKLKAVSAGQRTG